MLSIEHARPAIKGRIKLLHWSVEAWKMQHNKSDESSQQPAVQVFQLTHDIFRRFKNDLTPSDIVELFKALLLLGFKEACVDMKKEFEELSHTTAPIPTDLGEGSDRVLMSPAVFQLQHAGPVMLRNTGSQKDPRVTQFYPDAWQRKLLDIVDQKHSA